MRALRLRAVAGSTYSILRRLSRNLQAIFYIL